MSGPSSSSSARRETHGDFCGGVRAVRSEPTSVGAWRGGDGEDAGRRGAAEMRGARARHEVRALEVDAHHGVVASTVRLRDGEGPVRGGVVDDDVDAAETIDGGGDGGRHLVLVRDVGLEGEGVAPGGDARGGGVLDRAGERRVVLGGLREYHHVRAAARATHGDGLADASRRARHHDGAALHGEGEVRGGGLVPVRRQGVDVVLVERVAKPRETRLREGGEEVPSVRRNTSATSSFATGAAGSLPAPWYSSRLSSAEALMLPVARDTRVNLAGGPTERHVVARRR